MGLVNTEFSKKAGEIINVFLDPTTIGKNGVYSDVTKLFAEIKKHGDVYSNEAIEYLGKLIKKTPEFTMVDFSNAPHEKELESINTIIRILKEYPSIYKYVKGEYDKKKKSLLQMLQ